MRAALAICAALSLCLWGPWSGAEEPTRSPPASRPTVAKSKKACPSAGRLLAAYRKAIDDAMKPSQKKISSKLLPIARKGKASAKLRWRKILGSWHVLVATWTDYTQYPKPNKPYTTHPRFDIWVTAIPEFRRACRRIYRKHPCPSLRMKQLLGLSPKKKKTHVVEFWVRPSDLFRPCRDREIHDRRCGLAFPSQTPASHKRWFRRQWKWAFKNPRKERGAPWTQLGYTYDWGRKKRHVGLSEFAIQSKRRIWIHAITPTKQYCKGKR